MKITFIPQRRDDVLSLWKQGDVLTVSGDVLDFSSLPEGAILPVAAIENPFVVGAVERIADEICITVLRPCRDPEAWKCAPVTMTISNDGDIAMPVFDQPADEELPSNAD